MINEVKTQIIGILKNMDVVVDYDIDSEDETWNLDFLVRFDAHKSFERVEEDIKAVRDKILDLGNVEVYLVDGQAEDFYLCDDIEELWIDIYVDVINPNHWVWFNIGQKGDHYVQWQSAVINRNFDPRTIRLEQYKCGEDGLGHYTEWVTLDEFECMPKSVEPSFNDAEKVADAVMRDFHGGEEVYVGHNNWTYIYNLFDMGNKNKWGLGEPLWN